MFPTIGLCVRKIFLRIVGSQIEIKKVFSSTRISTNIKICCLQLENFNKLTFVNKNWPSDLRIGCKSPFSLVDLIENDVNLEKVLLKKFEGAFEMDKIVEL
jgi:hypothetical protein